MYSLNVYKLVILIINFIIYFNKLINKSIQFDQLFVIHILIIYCKYTAIKLT